MRTFNINTPEKLFERDSSISRRRSGYPPLNEADLMERLAAALRQREALTAAIDHMTAMLMTGKDEIKEAE
jgi:hypothetical protein